jgi:polar amino acid transport system substrate-binding protein
MKRLALLLALLLTIGVVVAGCGDDDATTTAAVLELDLVTEGVLTVCTDSPYPPMEYEENGEYTGFDIELMRAIAAKLGLDLEVINSGWDAIVSGLALETGECDIAAASITILPERDENVDFSDGYFSGDQSLLVKTDSGITTLGDLDGLRLGVQTDTTGAMYAEENAPASTEIVSYENPGDLILALSADEVDGVLQDIVTNKAQTLEDDTLEIVEVYETNEPYGFAVKEEGAEELVAAVNQALAEVRADGTYDTIYDEFFPEGS